MALPPVRPGSTPSVPAQATPTPPARSAAQRAFFDAALTKAGAVVTPAPVTRPQAASQIQPAAQPLRAERIVINMPDEPPQRILRPGSLLDIKV